MNTLLEILHEKKKEKAVKKHIIEIKNTSNDLGIDQCIGILDFIKTVRLKNTIFLMKLMRKVYGETVEASLINILYLMKEKIIKINNGINDNQYHGYDSYIKTVLDILGFLKTDKAEKAIFDLLFEDMDNKSRIIIENGLVDVVNKLHSIDAIKTMTEYVVRRNYSGSLGLSIYSYLKIIESSIGDQELKGKVHIALNKTGTRLEADRNEKEETRRRYEEEDREKKEKMKQEKAKLEWEKFLLEHPDYELDPSRMDR